MIKTISYRFERKCKLLLPVFFNAFLFAQLNTDWRSLESENFTIFYPTDYEWEANQVLLNLEFYKDSVVTLIGNDPGKIPIVIEDEGMSSNGYADSYKKTIHISTYEPGSESAVGFDQNWYRSTGVHEYTHISHLTNIKGSAKLPKLLFGDVFQPNGVSPAWVIEGISVFSESQQSPYEGRINDGYFDAVVASKAKAKRLPSIRAATNIIPTYPLGDWYLNGGMFFNYLAKVYGKEKIFQLFNEYGSYFWAPIAGFAFPGIGLDYAGKKIYGKSIKELYREWTDYEEEINKDWRVDGVQLTKSGWYKSFLKEYKGKVYYYKYYYNRIDVDFLQLEEFDPQENKERVIAYLKNPVSSPIHIFNGKVFFTIREIDKGYTNISTLGYTSILYSIDIITGKREEILKDDIRTFCILDNGDILYSKVQRHKFGSELWKFSNGKKTKLGSVDQLITELETEQNRVFAVSRTDYSSWDVSEVNLTDLNFLPITDSPWAEFDVNLKDNKLIYTANHNKVYSVFIYDLETKVTSQLTEGGFSRYGLTIENTLYFVGLSSKGEDIYKKQLVLNEWDSPGWDNPVPPDFSLLNLRVKKNEYSKNLEKMLIPYDHLFFPEFKGERLGLAFFGTDALSQNNYSLGVKYSFRDKEYLFTSWVGSKIFAPLYLSVYTNYPDYFNLYTTYPVYISSKPGLSVINAGSSVTFSERDFKRRTLTPNIDIRFVYPLHSIRFSASFPIQKTAWGSKRNELEIYVKSEIKRKTRFGYFGITGKGGYSESNTLIFQNRGKGSLRSGLGYTLSPSYSVQLFKFRRGFWNVNAFIEDFNGKIFMDYTRIKNGADLWATGGEISMETRLAFGFIRFSPVIGAAINIDMEWNYYWRLNFPLMW